MPYSETTRVIAIRHGETAWNVDTRIQGQLDVPLNERGREQARRLGQAMAAEDLHAIYASDLSRAHETASAVARRAGLAVMPARGLRERGFGIFEGYTFAEIEERWPEQSQRWRRRDPEFGPEGGETLLGFYTRAVAAATALAQAHLGQTIALVAHGGVMDCLYRAASRITLQAPRTWHLGNATINRLLYTPQGFTLVGWNDDYHLEDPSLDESEGDARVGVAE
ncbi:MAG: histidine phosphatase family protein [Betaproteobacteria bacterium]|nr:MAG: histidine phosphatase family protein [Betaproteobacteria bacterium]